MLHALTLGAVLLIQVVPISREVRLWVAEVRRWRHRQTRKRG